MHVRRLISPSLFFYLSFIPTSYAEDSENFQKKLVDIFGEQISKDQRIIAIPDNALTEIRQLPDTADPKERRKKSILSIVAKGFVQSEYGTSSNKRRISSEEWATISDTARNIERAAFHQNPDGSSLKNLDFENFLIQYSNLGLKRVS